MFVLLSNCYELCVGTSVCAAPEYRVLQEYRWAGLYPVPRPKR